MSAEDTSPVFLSARANSLLLLSSESLQVLQTLSFPCPFLHASFNTSTYIVTDTGDVFIYDTATLTLQTSIRSTGLTKLTNLMVLPDRIYCLQTGSYLLFTETGWTSMENREIISKLGTANSCQIQGNTYVVMSRKAPNPCTWCMNCRGTYVFEAVLYKLCGDTDLQGVGVEIEYGYQVPFLLPYRNDRIILIGARMYNCNTMIYTFHPTSTPPKCTKAGEILHTFSRIISACISRDRLYALYEDGSYLNVSLETGLGRFVSAKLKLFLWVVKTKMPKLTQNLVKEIAKVYLRFPYLGF